MFDSYHNECISIHCIVLIVFYNVVNVVKCCESCIILLVLYNVVVRESFPY